VVKVVGARSSSRSALNDRGPGASGTNAGPGLVALKVDARLMKKHGFICAESSKNGRHDISGSHKPSFAIADRAVSLSSSVVQPPVHEVEVLTAMVDLAVMVTGGPR
jgi:hypothetical protein